MVTKLGNNTDPVVQELLPSRSRKRLWGFGLPGGGFCVPSRQNIVNLTTRVIIIMKGIHSSKHGFTIVELLIVIVVIAILAAISIIAYNGIQQRAAVSVLQSDLTNAAKQMELANAETDRYPTSFPADVKASSNIVLSLSQVSSGFCINGEYKNVSSIRWRYESAGGGLQEGLCSGTVISGSESGTNPNLITDTSFTHVGDGNGQWRLSRNTSTIAGTVRSGTTGDPYPNRPVLRISNTADSAITWVYIGGPINATTIANGKTYVAKFYVRLASGTYNTAFPYFGIMNGNATNTTISNGMSSVTPSSSWQLITRTSTALQDGSSGNIIYFSISASMVKSNDFTLEFQGFELREQ